MTTIEKIAWKNLNEDSKTLGGKTIVTPKKIGEVYPLTTSGEDFMGVYLGKHQIYKKDKSEKNIFAVRTPNKDYLLYSSEEGLMLWHSYGDDGPEWPAGMWVKYEFKANDKNKKGIEKKFKDIFDKEIKLTL